MSQEFRIILEEQVDIQANEFLGAKQEGLGGILGSRDARGTVEEERRRKKQEFVGGE